MSKTSKLVREMVANALLTRSMALEEMAKAAVAKWGIDNCKLVEEMTGDGLTWRFEQIQQPPPRTPRLVDACEITLAYVRNMDTEAVFESFHAMELALAAEKKRQELRDAVIDAARVQQLEPEVMDAPCGCRTCAAIKPLDAYEKEEAR